MKVEIELGEKSIKGVIDLQEGIYTSASQGKRGLERSKEGSVLFQSEHGDWTLQFQEEEEGHGPEAFWISSEEAEAIRSAESRMA